MSTGEPWGFPLELPIRLLSLIVLKMSAQGALQIRGFGWTPTGRPGYSI